MLGQFMKFSRTIERHTAPTDTVWVGTADVEVNEGSCAFPSRSETEKANARHINNIMKASCTYRKQI